MSQWKVFTIDGYFKNSWFSGDCNESEAKKPRQTPTLENLKAVFSNSISNFFLFKISPPIGRIFPNSAKHYWKSRIYHIRISRCGPTFFRSFPCEKKLRNRANFVNLDTSCHNISHLFPHVALLVAWILHKCNVETPFHHMRNFLLSDCSICFCEKNLENRDFSGISKIFRKFCICYFGTWFINLPQCWATNMREIKSVH